MRGRYVQTGHKHLDWHAVELLGRHQSGREIPLEVSFSESKTKAEHIFTGVMRDVTEHKRAEAVMGAKSFHVVLRDPTSGALTFPYFAGERHEGPIHLLITDVLRPDAIGPELALQLRPARPDMKVLFISGHGDAAGADQGRLNPEAAFLQKPFSPDTLARKVREVLG